MGGGEIVMLKTRYIIVLRDLDGMLAGVQACTGFSKSKLCLTSEGFDRTAIGRNGKWLRQ